MKKFLFDTHNFDKARTDEAAKATFTELQMQGAREQGRQMGLAEAREAQEARIAALLENFSRLAEKMTAEEERREIEKCADAIHLAMKVVHKLLPQFARRCALGEVERVLVESLEMRRDEARIAVTVPTQHLDALKERIDPIAREKGYAGKIILLADDHLGSSDTRVEWADGGAERLYERLFSQVENEFAKAIATMNAALAEDTKTQQGK